jgi:hypothetical protein
LTPVWFTVSSAVRRPIAIGANVTATVQLAFAASVTRHGVGATVNSDASSPPIVSVLIVSGLLPVLVSVRFCVRVAPVATVPNASDGVSATSGPSSLPMTVNWSVSPSTMSSGRFVSGLMPTCSILNEFCGTPPGA